MKSDHRHELKSNELADWLTHLPEWSKENLSSIIIVIAAIVIVAGFYGWRAISNKTQSGEHEKFTTLVDDVLFKKAQIVSSPGSDMSFVLLDNASVLEKYSGSTGDKNIAALALVKAADSIRSELQYRTEIISQKDLVEKIEKAKKDYADAIAKNPSNNTIKGLAEYGLGLCAEELGNFDEAQKIYNGIVANAEYAGTINVSKAQLRLKIMDGYKQDIVFEPAPAQPIPDANAVLDPLIQQLRDARSKVNDSNVPLIIDSEVNAASLEINSALPIETDLPTGIAIPDDVNILEQ